MRLEKVAKLLILLMWPVSLFVANTLPDFVSFASPAFMVLISLWLTSKNSKYKYLPLLAIPIIEPKLAPLPLVFMAVQTWTTRTKDNIFLLILSVTMVATTWKGFVGQTIFTPDYEARQLVIRNQQLYPSPLTARMFHNKATIVSIKFFDNFFALIDPNNYFFGFAPRQVGVVNQNLDKLPALALPFLLFGLYYITKVPNRNFAISLLVCSLFCLCLLTLFDKQDFVLWPLICTITVFGLSEFSKHYPKLTTYYLPLFTAFTVLEYLRIIIRWS